MMLHLFSVAVLASALIGSISASSFRGIEEERLEGQFTCTMTAFDEGTCQTTNDDDGGGCVWCSYQTIGFCVSSDQSELIDGNVPQITCDDARHDASEELHLDESEPQDPFDPSCLVAGMNSDDAKSDCTKTQDSDGEGCIWCDAGSIYGLCLAPSQADAASEYLTCENGSFLIEPKIA